MAHVWNIIDGDIYVSKNGNDTTGDGSSANPYASINKATTEGVDGNKIVIGSGLWEEARGTSTNAYNYIGDGEVVFGYEGTGYFIMNRLLDKIESFKNIIFNNNKFSIFQQHPSTRDVFTKLDNCILYFVGSDGSNFSVYRQYMDFSNCLIKTFQLVKNGLIYIRLKNCTIDYMNFAEVAASYGYRTVNFVSIINTIFNKIDATPTYKQSLPRNDFYNLVYDGDNYFVTALLTEPTNIKLNPKFNNPEIGDYTLQPSSPCLLSGRNNVNIGAFGLGFSFNGNSSEFTEEGGAIYSQTNSENDIVRGSQIINGIEQYLFLLEQGHSSGNIESEWYDFQSIYYLLVSKIFDNIIYDSNGFAISRSDNLESSGETCIYYDFEFKYCLLEEDKATTTWKNFRWNSPLAIDDSGNGNASSSFTPSETKFISARFIKIKFYMKEE